MPDDSTDIRGDVTLAWEDHLECLREAAKAISGPDGARNDLDTAKDFAP